MRPLTSQSGRFLLQALDAPFQCLWVNTEASALLHGNLSGSQKVIAGCSTKCKLKRSGRAWCIRRISEYLSQLALCSEFQDSLGDTERPCPKNKNKKTARGDKREEKKGQTRNRG